MIKQKKGVALLWVLLISVVLMILSGTLVNFIIKEAKSSTRTENSIKAYSAAKSGVEWALQNEADSIPLAVCSSSDPTVGDTLNVDASVTAIVCRDGAEIIRSTGYAFGSMRSIEHKKVDYAYNTLSTIYPATLPSNTGSFELVFHFYHRGSTTAPWFVGLADATGTNRLGVYYTGTLFQDRFHITKKVAGVTTNSTSSASLSTLSPVGPDGLITAKLQYIKGEYAVLRFEGNYSRKGTCLNVISIDLRGDALGDLNRTKAYVESSGEIPAVQDGTIKLNLVASNGAELAYVTYFGYKLN